MKGLVWTAATRRVVPAAEAKVPYGLPGVLFGASLFETLRVIEGRFFRLERHLERLERAAESMGWVPPARETVVEGLARVLQDPGLEGKDLRVRITLLDCGDGRVPETIVWAEPYVPPSPDLYRRGVPAVIAPYRLDETAPWTTLKTGNRLIHQTARRRAERDGAWEALLLNTRGRLADGAISNIFFVSGGVLCTPGVDMGALPGIVRDAVADLVGELGLSWRPGAYEPQDLYAADEAFLTNALIGVVPLVCVDGRRIGSGVPGRLTQELKDLYERLREREAKLLDAWLP